MKIDQHLLETSNAGPICRWSAWARCCTASCAHVVVSERHEIKAAGGLSDFGRLQEMMSQAVIHSIIESGLLLFIWVEFLPLMCSSITYPVLEHFPLGLYFRPKSRAGCRHGISCHRL